MEKQTEPRQLSPETKALIREIDLSRMQTAITLTKADRELERAERVAAEITANMEHSQVEVDEARDVLRRAGLLRD